jgi:hypothetical protein
MALDPSNLVTSIKEQLRTLGAHLVRYAELVFDDAQLDSRPPMTTLLAVWVWAISRVYWHCVLPGLSALHG